MTDADIIKALERCINGDCSGCPLYAMNCSSKVVMAYAVDLINRQKAEIERWKQFASDTGMEVLIERAAKERLKSELENARAEAVKEFAERLKGMYAEYSAYDRLHTYEIIDRIEIVEEEMEGQNV